MTSSYEMSGAMRAQHANRAVAVVVLNWNGWADTLACLDSVAGSKHTALTLVVVDNGSTDESVERIREWGARRYGAQNVWEVMWSDAGLDARTIQPRVRPPLILVKSDTNLGFAKGVNTGMRIAAALVPEYYWILNNDTLVAPDCISRHIAAFERQPQAVCATSKIVYAHDPSRIWNCGGWVTRLGIRRYHGHGKLVHSVPAEGVRRITFVTGCSMFLRADVITRAGLFSEDFFFGEEDIEFSIRLQRLRLESICVYDAVVAHKVSESYRRVGGEEAKLGRAYLHYLNRFVHMRRYWSPHVWRAWRFAYLAYIAFRLKTRWRCSISQVQQFVCGLIKDSSRLRRVGHQDFLAAVGRHWESRGPQTEAGVRDN